ncbi:glycosyltransferase family 1 protein [Microbacterium aquimaris]|uniref:glycosyltransferase family 4 protein n=1 Tax=Microbacterium aquimaris TaxID=459816 RepID=UPI002AD3077D|nr:glycosyltransferase family 1 protein [Microbacterium aquimaris]MDZ8274543.1 glycosyltransferase family 1 protein [Microbacterium aquimaris]
MTRFVPAARNRSASVDAPRKLVINGRFLTQDVTGVQRVALELTREIDAMLEAGVLGDVDGEILVPSGVELRSNPAFKRLVVRSVGYSNPLLWEQVSLPIAARGATLLCLGNLAPVISLVAKTSDTYTMVHDLSYRYFPHAYTRSFRWLHRLLIPVVLRFSRRVFTVSQSEAIAIRKTHPRLVRQRLVAIQNGGGEQPAGRQLSGASESLAVGSKDVPDLRLRKRSGLYVGSLTERKNVRGLEAAAATLTSSHDAVFTFIGSTGEHFAANSAEDSEGIVRLGQVNDPRQVETHYRSARLFLFPSFYEASPMPVIEAMRYGCPVVAADIPSLRERCGNAAIYCDPSDVSSIVDAARRVLDDDRLARELQLRGLEHAAQFTWRRQARDMMREMGWNRLEW